jgi:hypothetical protein
VAMRAAFMSNQEGTLTYPKDMTFDAHNREFGDCRPC